MCVEAGAAFALSSDAHLPEHVGFGYEEAIELMAASGIEGICVFEGRRRTVHPVGAADGELAR
jgi:histidinol-phosphatase (PHP family)